MAGYITAVASTLTTVGILGVLGFLRNISRKLDRHDRRLFVVELDDLAHDVKLRDHEHTLHRLESAR